MPAILAIRFRAAFADGRDLVDGFVVPDTDNTLAVFLRWSDHWRIAHVPSGCGVFHPDRKLKFVVREQAIAFARRFYEQARDIGLDMKAANFTESRERIWEALPYGRRSDFWEKVL